MHQVLFIRRQTVFVRQRTDSGAYFAVHIVASKSLHPVTERRTPGCSCSQGVTNMLLKRSIFTPFPPIVSSPPQAAVLKIPWPRGGAAVLPNEARKQDLSSAFQRLRVTTSNAATPS